MRALFSAMLVGLMLVAAPAAAERPAAPVPLATYLEYLNDSGHRIIFSSRLVTADMIVAQLPEPGTDLALLPELLSGFGLAVREGPADSLLVVRGERAGTMAVPRPADEAREEITEIIVTSSLHRLEYGGPETHTYFDRELATRLPVVADEAVRLTDRLPGTANGGVSVQSYVRGGEKNEMLFLFDGLRLYQPFHLRDFQSVATIISSGAVGGLDFFTGAYPARFGDRMSGVTDISMRVPGERPETELGLSFFNTSALSLGRFGDAGQGEWLLSARRGNLDLVLDLVDPDAGDPDYEDYLAHAGWDFGDRAQIAFNVLASRDRIRLADVARGEDARAAYENTLGWIKWRADWSDVLVSETILAVSDIRDRRFGSVSLPGVVAGTLDDARDFDALELKQDWRLTVSDKLALRFGADLKNLDARYRVSSSRSIDPVFAAALGNPVQRDVDATLEPSGSQYAVYAEARLRPLERFVIDLGLRWDQQTYTTAEDDKQYSPRASLLYRSRHGTEWRVGWGQYYQAQEINELQVADGLQAFFAAQRAEHFVVNVKHSFASDVNVDISLYRKRFRTLRPRFENVFSRLTLLPELQFDRVRIDASGALARGAELTMTRGGSEDALFWWLGYAWSEVEDSTAAGKVKRSWDQTHTVRAGLSWRRGDWGFSVAGEVHTGWPRAELVASTDTDISGAPVLALQATARDAFRYSVFHALDARVSRKFRAGEGTVTLYLDVSNAYDRDNPCCVEYSIDAGATGADRLLGRERHWLPLLPSLGVIWRF